MGKESESEHNEFVIYKPVRNPLPTLFPVFTDINPYLSKDVNKFAADQLTNLMGGKSVNKTVINTGFLDAVVVPYFFLGSGLIIHEKNRKKLSLAMKTARQLSALVKRKNLTKEEEEKDEEYKEIQQQYIEEHGRHFKPIVDWTISHHYAAVILKEGWMVVKTVAGYPKPFRTGIRIVAKGYRSYAEIGLDFIEKYHCCFCLLSPKWAQQQTALYHFFVDASHKDCPFAKK